MLYSIRRKEKEKTGITRHALCTALNGSRNMDVEEYAKICDALGLDYEYFFNKRAKALFTIPEAAGYGNAGIEGLTYYKDGLVFAGGPGRLWSVEVLRSPGPHHGS